MPTFPAPKKDENSLYFELDKAFNGEAYHAFWPFSYILAIAFSAIHVFPEPVGAVTRQSVFSIAETASSWKGSGVKGFLSGIPIEAKTFFNPASAPGLIFGILDLFLKYSCLFL